MKKKLMITSIIVLIIAAAVAYIIDKEKKQFNVIYETCSNPDIIEYITLFTNANHPYIIDDRSDIELWCSALKSTKFAQYPYQGAPIHAINKYYDFTVIVQTNDLSHDYSLQFPVGRLFKRRPGSELLTTLYTVEDTQFLDAWVEDMFNKYPEGEWK